MLIPSSVNSKTDIIMLTVTQYQCVLLLTHTHTQPFYGSLNFVQDKPGELVSKETFTHSHLY